MWSGVLISNCKPAKRLQFEKEETGSEDKRLRAWRGDSFRRGRFRRASGGPIFSLAREKIGKKRVLGRVWCILRCDSGRNLIYRYYEHTYSPYGRYGTRRLLRYIRFVNSCDSISAVKTPFVQNLQGSTDSPKISVKPIYPAGGQSRPPLRDTCASKLRRRGRRLCRPNEKLRIRRGFQ